MEDLLDLDAALFECSASEAADQIRSRDRLEGALARPQAYAVYEGADISVQAAALADGIAEGQYFVVWYRFVFSVPSPRLRGSVPPAHSA
jgi:hypothetical protein